MERLLFTDLKTSNSKLVFIRECFIALLISIGTFLCMKDLFGFSYTLKTGFTGGLTGGLVKTWNTIAAALGGSDYILLPQYAGQSQNNGLFLTLCIILGAVAAYVIIRQRNVWALAIFLLPALMINLFTELDLSQQGTAFLLLSLLLGLLYIKSEGQGFLHHLILVVIMGVIIYSAFQLPGLDGFVRKPGFVHQLQEVTEEFTGKIYYGENPLKNGDFSQRKRPSEEGTSLEITMENPQSMYLRGYTGDVFTEDGWLPLSDQVYYEVSEQMNWHEKMGFNPLGQLGQAKKLSGAESESGKVEIHAVGADKRYAYVPYEFEQFEEGKKPEIKGGNIVQAQGLQKFGNYVYTAADNATEDWTDTAARIFTEAEKSKDGQEELNQYYLEESNYNTYVYTDFTYVSSMEKQLIHKEIGESGDQSKGHIDYKYAINKIRKYLDENFIYTENRGNEPKDKIPMLKEFFETKKGYDVQYATAATLMFRYYGIPARYVEGYLVTPEDVKGVSSGETIELGFNRAHAWTEIYIDGVGFVPVEVSPEYKGVMKEADMNTGISNNTLLRQFEAPEDQKDNGGEAENGGDDDKTENWKKLIFMAVIAVVILALLITIIGKLAILLLAVERRRKLFRKEEPKTAISAMYGYMEEKQYPVNEKARELGNRAAYSPEQPGEEERALMLGWLKDAKRLAGKEKKAMKKQRRNKKNGKGVQ